MYYKVDLKWSGIATFAAAQQCLNDVKTHQDILALPLDALNFARRFASYIKRCPAPHAYGRYNTSFTQMEAKPEYHVGFFHYDYNNQEVTFTIGYEKRT